MFSGAITPGKAIARKPADIVIRGMAAGLLKVPQHLSIYISAKDQALSLSRF